MQRRSFSRKERARRFEMHGGICHLCGGKIHIGEDWELEHVIEWHLTRDDSDENVKPAHKSCHGRKTHEEDRPRIQKAKNQEAAHKGFKRPKQSIRSAGFDKKERKPKRALPPRQLFEAKR